MVRRLRTVQIPLRQELHQMAVARRRNRPVALEQVELNLVRAREVAVHPVV